MDNTKFYTNDISKIRLILENYGVAVLENYFDDEYADEVFLSVKEWMINLNSGLTNDPNTWITRNLPIGPRYGMS